MIMKPRMRLSSSIEVTYDKSEPVSSTNSKSLDISDRMKKLLTSPLIKRKLTTSISKVFGAPLESLALSEENSDVIPFVLFRLCHYIEDSGGLIQEGLFRISGNAKLIEKLKNSFDSTGDAPLESEGDIASASALLKLFLRELPQPLISESSSFLDVIKKYPDDKQACIIHLRSLVALLPNENFIILKYLTKFLAKVSYFEDQNRMNPASLGIVFGPNIFRVSADNYQGLKEQALTNQVVSLFITNYKDIFNVEEEPVIVNKFEPLTVEIPSLESKSFDSLIQESSNVRFSFCRKRKERKFSSINRSNSEEKLTENKITQIRRCNSQDNILNKCHNPSLNLLNIKFDFELSPKPPEPKRRELDSKYVKSCYYDTAVIEDSNNLKENNKNDINESLNVEKKSITDNNSGSHLSGVVNSNKDSTPRLDFKTLHHNAGTNEPLLSEHRYSWPHMHVSESENTSHTANNNNNSSNNSPINITSQFLKKANSYEAPVSPSAYRGYLNHRNQYLDSTIPPSPPIEQEEIYSKREFYDNPAVRVINKKIHFLKKKLKQFDQDFEKEHGYRPSLEQKMNSESANSYLKELNKLKKDFKEFKDEFQMMDIYGKNQFIKFQIQKGETNFDKVDRSPQKLKQMMKEIEDILVQKRLLADRPEQLDNMDSEQIIEEKLSLQKELLKFESIYGRPTTKTEREIVRTLYDRYRVVKRLVSKLPPQKTGSKDSIELQPILEHETMNFISPSHSKSKSMIEDNSKNSNSELSNEDNIQINKRNSLQYNNFHEMPLFELKRQLQNANQEKRNLRSILRDFERDFQKRMGRRVEKEDKIEMESIYINYKHIKGKVRLLEALISKHQFHRFK